MRRLLTRAILDWGREGHKNVPHPYAVIFPGWNLALPAKPRKPVTGILSMALMAGVLPRLGP